MEKFIGELKNIFAQNLLSVFIYGSKAHEENPNKDTNLFVITNSLEGEEIKKCTKLIKNWIKNNPMPVFMNKNEWFNSQDVYALEYSDIIENHKIIYGENLIQNIEIKKEDLRLQCEHEAKNLLMRFRSSFLAQKTLKCDFIPATKSAIAIFKGILRYKDISVPKDSDELISLAAQTCGLDEEFFTRLLKNKQGTNKIKNCEIVELASKMSVESSKLLSYTNNM